MSNIYEVKKMYPSQELYAGNCQGLMKSKDVTMNLSLIGVETKQIPDSQRAFFREDIISPDFQKTFKDILRKAMTELEKHSAQTPLGYILTASSAEQVFEKLEGFQKDWYDALEERKDEYEESAIDRRERLIASAYANDASDETATMLEALLLKAQPSWEEIVRRYTFDFGFISVVVGDEDFDSDKYSANKSAIDIQRQSLKTVREGVKGSLIQEACKLSLGIYKNLCKQEAKALLEGSATRVHPRSVNAVGDLIEKLDTLGFIHKEIQVVHETLVDCMSKFSVGGSLYGDDYRNFKTMVKSLSDQIDVVYKLEKGIPLVVLKSSGNNGSLPLTVPEQVTPVEAEIEAVEVAETIASDTVEDHADVSKIASATNVSEKLIETSPGLVSLF
jgi:hypothetical protein